MLLNWKLPSANVLPSTYKRLSTPELKKNISSLYYDG